MHLQATGVKLNWNQEKRLSYLITVIRPLKL